MRQSLKSTTLESVLPILSVENGGFIISKYGDITAAFRVELPEIFTISANEYKSLHECWVKAIKTLPVWTILHKQDWFIQKSYQVDFMEDMTPLARAQETSFFERPYLDHRCYLYITLTDKKRFHGDSSYSTLCRGFLVPKRTRNKQEVKHFIECVGQMVQILNDSELIKLTPLTSKEIMGSEDTSGIFDQYLSLSTDATSRLEDIEISSEGMRVGEKQIVGLTLSDLDSMPGEIGTSIRYDPLSVEKADCTLSYMSPLALLLNVDHIYNQYIFLEDAEDIFKELEGNMKRMDSLAKYSKKNQTNSDFINAYLDYAHQSASKPVKVHANVLVWGNDNDSLSHARNSAISQITRTGCRPRVNTTDMPALFWGAIPGNAGDLPIEECFLSFLEQGVCMFNLETNYHDSLSPVGIKMTEPLTGRPVHIDITYEPREKGYIDNFNKLILGPPGTGKSFFTNHYCRECYEQNTHIFMVDIGGSYKAHCQFVNERTNGEDGIYFTYTIENPLCFNPFFYEDNRFDVERMESIKSLMIALWKREDELPSKSEEVALSNALNIYIGKLQEGTVEPSFNAFYEYVQTDYRELLLQKKVREKDFDVDGFLNVLEPFYRGGQYGFLLNSDKNMDLLRKRFVVFDLDNIKDNKTLFPVVTIFIMESFFSKMRLLPRSERKILLIEEAWKAISRDNMAEYLRYMVKTVRKFNAETCIVTQELNDIISSPIIKETIIDCSHCKILLDQSNYVNKFDEIARVLGLTEKEVAQIMGINKNNNPDRKYKQVWIGLNGRKSAVYNTEVSLEEYFLYTSEGREYERVHTLSKEMGSIQKAVRFLADERRREMASKAND